MQVGFWPAQGRQQLWQPSTWQALFTAYVVVFIATGCTSFEHPLPWSQSPHQDELIGDWHTWEDAPAAIAMAITEADDTRLAVELKIAGSAEGSVPTPSYLYSTDTRHITFDGKLLAHNDVHVLQIAMETYTSRTEAEDDGKFSAGDLNGYRFVRVIRNDDEMTFQLLEMSQFAHLAERLLVDEEPVLTVAAVTDCVDTKVETEILSRFLRSQPIENVAAWLTAEELKEFEAWLDTNDVHTIEPYTALHEMRVCIAYKLPSDRLAQLFTSATDESFQGATIHMVRRNEH